MLNMTGSWKSEIAEEIEKDPALKPKVVKQVKEKLLEVKEKRI